VVNSSSHGAVTLQDDEGTLFKVNGQENSGHRSQPADAAEIEDPDDHS
jgi:hypothetical protein